MGIAALVAAAALSLSPSRPVAQDETATGSDTATAVETAPLPPGRPAARAGGSLLPNGARPPSPGADDGRGAALSGARGDPAAPAGNAGRADGIESSALAPPRTPEAADEAEAPPGPDERGPDGERVIEDPAEAASADAEGEAARAGQEAEGGGRFKRAPFRTPEFPETDRSITLGAADEADSARVAILDMVTARTETVELDAGRPTRFQRLTLTLIACAKPEQQGGVGDVGLFEIADDRAGAAPVFAGWMFAESPALSALDHPRYDVWLISCIARSPETTGGSASNDASRASASESSAR